LKLFARLSVSRRLYALKLKDGGSAQWHRNLVFASIRALLHRLSTEISFQASPVSKCETMTETNPYALMFLCQPDGRIITADRQAVLLLCGENDLKSEKDAKIPAKEFTIAQIAEKLSSSELIAVFKRFADGDQGFNQSLINCGSNDCQLSLRRLNGFQSQPLIAIELNADDRANRQEAMFAEVGRATSKLLHDFKNQMGGLKLYAAYLKKRFGSNPDLAEGLEIVDKISQSVNEMTENAALIGRLTRPLELKFTEINLQTLIEQVINQLQPEIAERGLKLERDMGGHFPPIAGDQQQIQSALTILTAACVASLPDNGVLKLRLRTAGKGLQFSILDSVNSLNDEQRQTFFDFLTSQRLNKDSLNLALAKRIIESHGGQVAALAAQPSGTEFQVKFKF